VPDVAKCCSSRKGYVDSIEMFDDATFFGASKLKAVRMGPKEQQVTYLNGAGEELENALRKRLKKIDDLEETSPERVPPAPRSVRPLGSSVVSEETSPERLPPSPCRARPVLSTVAAEESRGAAVEASSSRGSSSSRARSSRSSSSEAELMPEVPPAVWEFPQTRNERLHHITLALQTDQQRLQEKVSFLKQENRQLRRQLRKSSATCAVPARSARHSDARVPRAASLDARPSGLSASL